jgi:hypothetical protein
LELNVLLSTLLVLSLFALVFSNVSKEIHFFFFIITSSLVIAVIKAGSFGVDRYDSFLIFRVRVLNLSVILLLVDRSENGSLVPVLLHYTGDDNESQ